MKVIKQLIDYFISSGTLDEFDIRFLTEQGFYVEEKEEYWDGGYYDEDDEEYQSSEEKEEEARLNRIEKLTDDALLEGLLSAKKGKGHGGRMRKTYLTAASLNEEILTKTGEWSGPLKPLLDFTGAENAEAVEILKNKGFHDYDNLAKRVKATLFYDPFRIDSLFQAASFTAHLEFVLEQSKRMKGKQQGKVLRWLLNSGPRTTEGHEGFVFVNQCIRMQRAVLLEWKKHHEELSNRSGKWSKYYRELSEWESGMLPTMTMLSFSEKGIPLPELGHSIYSYFFNNNEREALRLFLTLFPRRFHQLCLRMKSVQSAANDKGENPHFG